jgi:LytR cell envelope-related transcriptional attenuator
MARVNLSPARLAILVALVVAGLAVILNGFGDDATVLAGDTEGTPPTETGTPSPTGSVAPTASETALPDTEAQVDGVMIQVLNGTNAVGLAAEVMEFLEGKGYVAALPPADAAQKPVETTTVYFRGGADADQNEIDAEHLARRFLKEVEPEIEPLSDTLDASVAPRAQLVVLLGNDYAEANPVG